MHLLNFYWEVEVLPIRLRLAEQLVALVLVFDVLLQAFPVHKLHTAVLDFAHELFLQVVGPYVGVEVGGGVELVAVLMLALVV